MNEIAIDTEMVGYCESYQPDYIQKQMLYPRRAKRALGSRENSSGLTLIDSDMAGRMGLKLGGMVEGMQENVLAKEFF